MIFHQQVHIVCLGGCKTETVKQQFQTVNYVKRGLVQNAVQILVHSLVHCSVHEFSFLTTVHLIVKNIFLVCVKYENISTK